MDATFWVSINIVVLSNKFNFQIPGNLNNAFYNTFTSYYQVLACKNCKSS
jgi:hypothetical protein